LVNIRLTLGDAERFATDNRGRFKIERESA
jgi:hypothetical protein